MEPREVMQATKKQIGDIGAAFYFHPDTLATGKELNLDGFRFYVLGRGGVLGDVEAEVVRSAFGYFAPGLVEKIWNSAKERVAPREAARAYIECNQALGRAKLADVEGLDAFVEAAGIIVGAVDPGALALFAGVKSEPVPDDAPAAAIHQAMVLRELRGSAHLVALAAVGLSTAKAHAIKRPDDVATFGYAEPPVVTDDDRSKHVRAETVTDDVLESAYARLTEAQSDAFVAGVAAIHAALFS